MSCTCGEDGIQAVLAVEGVRWFHRELSSEKGSSFGAVRTHQTCHSNGCFYPTKRMYRPIPESASDVPAGDPKTRDPRGASPHPEDLRCPMRPAGVDPARTTPPRPPTHATKSY